MVRPGYTLLSLLPTFFCGRCKTGAPLPLEGPKKKKFFPDFCSPDNLGNNRTEEAHPHIKANNVKSHHTLLTTYYTRYCSAATVLIVVCCLVVHCMVGWLTGILEVQHLHRLAVPRPSQACHDLVCECGSNNTVRDVAGSGAEGV